jgi:uracil-DNA glycosylase family 4
MKLRAVDPRRWWRDVEAEVVECRACPRLVAWREGVAQEKRAAFRDQTYWGRPVPAFGDPRARLVILGLAPAAHGANRTGRMFTGDNSGVWLFRALYKAGFASQPTSTGKDDGLRLLDCIITATVRCAPPANKPLPAEITRCSRFLDTEMQHLHRAQVVLALGRMAWDAYLAWVIRAGHPLSRPRPAFAHGKTVRDDFMPHILLGSYHPSQQNTYTGRLTLAMFDDVFAAARRLIGP